jgi:hypothetical protein
MGTRTTPHDAPSNDPASVAISQAAEFTLTLTRRCAAPASVVYGVLADPLSHLEWGGQRQWRVFRLTSLDAPPGPLVAGSQFTSTGSVFFVYPASDRSRVTVAEPGRVLEFLTENRYARRCEGTYLNRYELTPDGDGCVVTYTFQRLRIARPPLHMRAPMRLLIQRFGAPRMFGRGLDNLVRTAEAVAAGQS